MQASRFSDYAGIEILLYPIHHTDNCMSCASCISWAGSRRGWSHDHRHVAEKHRQWLPQIRHRCPECAPTSSGDLKKSIVCVFVCL
jgi:hypothetical protein